MGVPGGALELDGVAVTGTNAFPDGTLGRGLDAEQGAHVVVQRTLLDQNRDVAVYASNSGTDVTLTDVIVKDTQSEDIDGTDGRGLGAQDGAHVIALRTLFDHNHEVGVFAWQPGTVVALTDVVVRDTQSQESDLQLGTGLAAREGAHVTALRALFDHNREAGVFAWQPGTTVALTDVVVRDTQSRDGSQWYGRGLQAQDGAQVTTLRALFDRNRDVGVVAIGPETDLSLTDVAVNDTQPRDADGEYGVGVAAAGEATLELRSSRIAGSRVAGVLAMSGGELTLVSCEVVATEAGSITLLGPDGIHIDGAHYDDIADGILVVGGSSATLSGVRVAECLRAGILFGDSAGSLASVVSTGNRLGLAAQGDPRPSYDAQTCDFSGNSEQAILTDGNLPVPNAPLAVPEAP